MRANNLGIGTQSNLFRAQRISQAPNQDLSALKQGAQKERKDSVAISPLGKANSLIESLLKQKQSIMDNKEKLVSSTLADGGGIEGIKSQLDAYKEQLASIDEQISQTMIDQAKQPAEGAKTAKDITPKTEEAIQSEQLNSVVRMAASIDQSKVLSSIKARMDGEARVLKSEIQLDSARGGSIEKKHSSLANLEKRAAELNVQMGDRMAEISDDIKKTNNDTSIQWKDADKAETPASEAWFDR